MAASKLAVMKFGLRLSAREHHPNSIISAPAHLAAVSNAIGRHIQQEFFRYPCVGRYSKLGSVVVLVLDGTGDFRILNAGDYGGTFQHALAVLASRLTAIL